VNDSGCDRFSGRIVRVRQAAFNRSVSTNRPAGDSTVTVTVTVTGTDPDPDPERRSF